MKAACAIVICTSFLGSGLAIGGREASGTIPGDHARLAVPYADVQRLLEAIEKDSVVVQAKRAPFSKKDLLKARGYRWNADARFWQKELGEEFVAHEQAWFYCQGLPAPTLRPISAHQRHR